MVYQILGGLLVIVYIVLLVMCRKTWRVTHMISAFFVFAAAVTTVVFAGLVLKTRTNWGQLHAKYTRAVADAEALHARLLQGDPLAKDQNAETLRGLRTELNIVKLRRGRVWRNCVPAGAVDASTLRVNMATANVPPNTPLPEKPLPHGIKEKLTVYVFAEADPGDGVKVPAAFLGEFLVKEATEAEITISPELPLDNDQTQRIKQSVANQTTWMLYELIPLDGYELFAKPDPAENMLVGMERDELKKYIPNLPTWPETQYEKFLDTFVRFNRPAADDDPPENVWVQVKFLKEHTIPVDADALQSALDSPSYFDSQGRAVVAPLRRGDDKEVKGEVKFVKDDITIFDQATAKQLTELNICEPVKRVYRRQLHDYTYFFHELFHRHLDLDDSKRRAERDAKAMAALATKAQEQQAFYEVEKVQLLKELGRFRQEKDEATARRASLEAQWMTFVEQLRQYYRKNLELNDELMKLQYEMANQINQRALTVPSGPPATDATH